MSFAEDPARLSKSRLKSDLVAHNVALPPAESNKRVYVELHLKHIRHRNAADFSSDEDDPVAEEDLKDAEVPDPSHLTDDDLKATLLKHGFRVGPIVASTRAVYERKLLQLGRHDRPNREEQTALYSDSEEEDEEEENGEDEGKESGSEREKQETAEQSEQQERSQNMLNFQNGASFYPRCFLLSSRLHAPPPPPPPRNREPSSKWSSRNTLKSSERSRPPCSQVPKEISRKSSVDQRSGLGSGSGSGSGVPSGSQSVIPSGHSSFSSQAFSITQMMESRSLLSASVDPERELNGSNVQEHWSRSNRLDMPIVDKYKAKNQSPYYTPESSPRECGMEEPVNSILKDIFPDTKTSPTGIYATCRKPIKGAAGRPVQYAYPDIPVSPATLERLEVERRLTGVHIQYLVFLAVACILYLIYINAEVIFD